MAPDHIEALRRLGDLALLRGDVQAAGARYSRILELDAADVPAMIKLGVVSVRSGRADEAMRLFRQAIAQEPNNAEALLYLAGALASGGRPAEALPYFERALAAGPRSTMALNGLGLTRLAVGDGPGRRRRVPRVAAARSEAGGRPQALADLDPRRPAADNRVFEESGWRGARRGRMHRTGLSRQGVRDTRE